jgi:hypothetical protein
MRTWSARTGITGKYVAFADSSISVPDELGMAGD